MVQWQQGRCLDPGIWNHLRHRMNARLIPAPSVLQIRPPAKRKLENVDLGDLVRIFIVQIVLIFQKGWISRQRIPKPDLLFYSQTGYTLHRRNDAR